MEYKDKKLQYETTTEEGTHVKVEGPNIPATKEAIKETTKEKVEEVKNVLTEGSLPTNEQIDKNLSDAKRTLKDIGKEGHLDEQGKLLERDMEEIIDTASKFLHEKNKDDKLQKLYEESRQAVQENKEVLQSEVKKTQMEFKGEGKAVRNKGQNIVGDIKEGTEKIKEKGKKLGKETQEMVEEMKPQAQQLQKDTKQLLVSLKNFFWNFLKSEDFRGLTADWVAFFQFLATYKIKETVKKVEEKGGDVTANVAKAIDEGLTQPPKPADKEELQEKTRAKFNELLDRIRTNPEYQQAARDFIELMDQVRDHLEILAEDIKRESKEVVEDVKERTEKISEQMKQMATEVKEGVKVKSEKETRRLESKISTEKETRQLESRLKTDNFWKALYDARDVIAEFTGREELEQFLDTLWETYLEVRDDPELNNWFWDFKIYITSVIDNPEDRSEEKKQQANDLLDRGRSFLYKDKWGNQFNKLNARFEVLLQNIKADSTTQEFGEKVRKFVRDFALNKQGYPDLNVMEDSLIQVKNMLIPLFKKQLEQIKIGKIEFYNDTWDVKIEDIGFSGSFLPEHIDFHMRNDSHLDTTNPKNDVIRHILQSRISHIKPEFHNFKFYYRRKTFPKIEDWGMADMKIAGSGAYIQVTWVIASTGGQKPIARLAEVSCHIDKLDLHVIGEKTHHDILDKMLIPFVSGTIKNKLSGTIEDLLRTKLADVNDKLNELLQSKPLETLKEKTNESLQQGFEKLQESTKSVSAV